MASKPRDTGRGTGPKLPWETPQLRSIRAGAAENGFGGGREDGQFTKS